MKRMLSALAAAALAAPVALAGPSHYVKVSPNPVTAGSQVKVYGSVGNGCPQGSQVTLYSKAFRGSTKKNFAGVPAVFAKVGKNGSFSKKVTINTTVPAKKYTISGRCGGGRFGSAKLTVNGQFY